MAFKRHSSRKPSQKYHVYYPQLDQKSQDRIQPVDQRRINLDSFYISGFIHQEQNQLLTSKISRGSLGKDSNITSKRKEAQRTKLGQNDLALMMKTSPYLHKKSLVDRKQGRPKVRSRHIEQYFVTVRNEMEVRHFIFCLHYLITVPSDESRIGKHHYTTLLAKNIGRETISLFDREETSRHNHSSHIPRVSYSFESRRLPQEDGLFCSTNSG
jgi:hypothetical protein